ncbi:SIR2 family NAD-dependent protein deacylase [Jatrophihabitans fulvus]
MGPAYHEAVPTLTLLTGAGISTDSGIPDYRGPQGLWRQDPENEKLVTYDYYVADADIRRRSWLARQANPAWNASPNAAHLAVAARPDAWVITQNVDRLHQRAGSPADRVLELHGNMVEAECIDCAARSTTQEALDRLAAGEDDPRCLVCGGILKTATVMFGQMLDERVLRQAASAAEQADVFVAVGTSLQVHPAAGLVDIAAAHGARIVIVNDEPTPYDDLADEIVREPIGTSLPALLERL